MGEKSDYHHITKISSLKNGGYSSWECVGFPVLGAVESPQVIYLYQMQVVKHDDFKEVQVIARRFLVWCAVLVGFTVGRPGMGVIFRTVFLLDFVRKGISGAQAITRILTS